MLEKRKDTNFETLPDTLLAEILRSFFAEVRKQDKKPYSKSAMINLRAGLNRYLQSPPHNRIINLMHNDTFQNANSVFSGVLRDNKEKGFDVSKPKTGISQADLNKLYDKYLLPGIEQENTEVLQHKVFFDLIYYTARRGKEGLRALKKEYFQVKFTAEGREYVEIVVNETTKKNQGDNCSTRINTVYNDDNILFSQPGSPRCPVKSFKNYMEMLSDKIPDFFQQPNVRKKRFDAMAVGKNTLQDMMKTIAQNAGLSRKYTNHNIRRTSGNAIKKSGAPAPRIAHHLKQKNIQSMMQYLDMPTIEEKQENAEFLHEYTHNQPHPKPSASSAAPVQAPVQIAVPPPNPPPLFPNNPNVVAENAIIPFEPIFDDNQNEIQPALPQQMAHQMVQQPQQNNSQVVTNQVKQAPVLFQGATFHGCTINLQVPK